MPHGVMAARRQHPHCHHHSHHHLLHVVCLFVYIVLKLLVVFDLTAYHVDCALY